MYSPSGHVLLYICKQAGLFIIAMQGDSVVGEVSVVNLCPKEPADPEPADDFTDLYRLAVCVSHSLGMHYCKAPGA